MRFGLLRRSFLALALAAVSQTLGAQPGSAGAQSKSNDSAALSNIPEFDKLRTPQSPVFEILGIATSTVEKPTTPSAVAISLLSSFVSGNQAILPKQYALDVAPFWLFSHPRLTLILAAQDKNRAARRLGTIWNNIQQTFTVGLAAADSAFKTTTVPGTDTSISRLAFSIRFSPIRGHLV